MEKSTALWSLSLDPTQNLLTPIVQLLLLDELIFLFIRSIFICLGVDRFIPQQFKRTTDRRTTDRRTTDRRTTDRRTTDR